MMLLLDALYINNSGAKVLLDYLIEQFELSGVTIYYLLDERIKDTQPQMDLSKNKIHYLKASFVKRHLFYLKNSALFSHVFCFGNIPPSVKLKIPVYTYFHQTLYIKKSGNESLKKSILLVLKSNVLAFYKKNTNKWFVQSISVKNDLVKRFALNTDDVLVLPFYPPLSKFKNDSKLKKKNSFLFVSGGNPHKNHISLLKAFEIIYKKGFSAELHLTISDDFSVLKDYIDSLKTVGVPIINHGFVPRNKIAELYSKVEYCIYPSLRESFGLGLIEAMESNCKAIASDLPYVHAVCKPSLVFDPHSVDSIEQAIETALTKNFPDTHQLVHNQIDDLIELFQN